MQSSRIREEIRGVLSMLGSLVILISLVSHNPWDASLTTSSSELKNLLGAFGSNLSDIMLQSVGYTSYLFPVILAVYGIRNILGRHKNYNVIVFLVSFTTVTTALSSLLSISFTGRAGGALGIAISSFSVKFLSVTGSYLIFTALLLVSLMYLIPFTITGAAGVFRSRLAAGGRALAAMKFRQAAKRRSDHAPQDEPGIYEEYFEQEELPLAEPEIRSKPKVRSVTKPPRKVSSSYELPGIDLLKDPGLSRSRQTKEDLISRSNLLEKKLLDYSIEGQVTYVSPGPIVTMFEFEPAPGIKISRVMALADDLAMALKANSIRISPIHGRSTLGIEVPNRDREDVVLKDIISNESFVKSYSRLTIALGKDIFGAPVIADLSRMPHLLIAGATGSGKSVGLNSIILSLLFRATPQEVKMLMIDPKMLELSAYEDIPHLLMPVITLPKEASNALKTLVAEMERRYRLLADSGAKNIETFNRKVLAGHEKGKDEESPEPLPYIVIFIDELADLMFTSGREVEDSIVRLSQMARAAGIHMILATQRPSVDVITGIIKANLPSRISFQVSSKLDSRIILDTYGAEQLLGKGDMLFTRPGKKIKRIHGAYVSEEEIKNVVSFIKAQAGPDYTLFEEMAAPAIETPAFEEQDELYTRARDMVIAAGQASISYIQRRMKIGYNRAARIMEMLEEEGIVGPPGDAGKPREVLRRRQG